MALSTIVITFAPLGISLLSLLVAVLSRRDSQSANGISEQALTTAKESNSIAAQANQLAQDANTISHRALDISSENFDYRFTFDINDEGKAIIENASPYEALSVTVIINPNNPTETRNFFDRIAPSSDATFDVQRLFQQHIERARQQPETIVAHFNGPVYDGLQPLKTNIIAIIQFKTPAGRADGCILEYSLCHRQDGSGDVIRC